MFKSFGRSWELTKLSFNVLMKDKELFAYPVLSFIITLFMIALLILPLLFSSALKNIGFTGIGYLGVLIFYFVMALVATFFNFCVVYTASIRFRGGNAKFGGTISYAFSKFGRIVQWSLVTAVVGLIISILRGKGNRGGISSLLLKIFAKGLEIGWKVATVFSIPVIVYKNIGPFSAIKESVNALKKTWGEQIIRYVGVNIVTNVFMFVGFIMGLLGTFIIFGIGMNNFGGIFALVTLWSLVIIYWVLVGLVFSLISSIFNTALYVYAETGNIPEGFTKEQLHGAVEGKN